MVRMTEVILCLIAYLPVFYFSPSGPTQFYLPSSSKSRDIFDHLRMVLRNVKKIRARKMVDKQALIGFV